MTDQYQDFFTKPTPKTILIFGATGHIGGPAAEYISKVAPDINLRLSTSRQETVADLQSKFSNAEVVVADYMDSLSLEKAVDGIEGIFCITSLFTEEAPAMENLVKAVNKSGTLVHMVRQLGLTPEVPYSRLPDFIKDKPKSLPVQHIYGRETLDKAAMPVTYLNCGGSFMDNFSRLMMVNGLRRERKLIWPERQVPYLDPDEVGEMAARLLLTNDHRHIGKYHTINNGHDFLKIEQIAELMSEVWGETITYDGSKESYFKEYLDIRGEEKLNTLWSFFDYDRSIEVAWSLNDCAERILGRKPKTLREWLIENKDMILHGG